MYSINRMNLSPVVLLHLSAGCRVRYRCGETLERILGRPLQLPGPRDPAAMGERTVHTYFDSYFDSFIDSYFDSYFGSYVSSYVCTPGPMSFKHM